MQGPTLRLETLSDDDLLARLADVLLRGRRVEAELVWHLAEVDRRRLYLREACPSMHVYATQRLRMSDAEAYLRITVARVSRRFPVVLALLADGRLHLSAIAKLAPHLGNENGEALLGRAVHKSKREIEVLIAELAPRPDVPSLMRRLPAELRPDGVQIRAVGDGPPPVVDPSTPPAAPTVPTTPPTRVATPPAAPAVVTPLAPARFKIQFTASGELNDKITHAQALLRHQIPSGDLAAVFDRAVCPFCL